MALCSHGGLHESRVLTISNRADVERAVASATWLTRPRVGAVHVAIESVSIGPAPLPTAPGSAVCTTTAGAVAHLAALASADLQITVFEELGDEAPWRFRLGCRGADV